MAIFDIGDIPRREVREILQKIADSLFWDDRGLPVCVSDAEAIFNIFKQFGVKEKD